MTIQHLDQDDSRQRLGPAPGCLSVDYVGIGPGVDQRNQFVTLEATHCVWLQFGSPRPNPLRSATPVEAWASYVQRCLWKICGLTPCATLLQMPGMTLRLAFVAPISPVPIDKLSMWDGLWWRLPWLPENQRFATAEKNNSEKLVMNAPQNWGSSSKRLRLFTLRFGLHCGSAGGMAGAGMSSAVNATWAFSNVAVVQPRHPFRFCAVAVKLCWLDKPKLKVRNLDLLWQDRIIWAQTRIQEQHSHIGIKHSLLYFHLQYSKVRQWSRHIHRHNFKSPKINQETDIIASLNTDKPLMCLIWTTCRCGWLVAPVKVTKRERVRPGSDQQLWLIFTL